MQLALSFVLLLGHVWCQSLDEDTKNALKDLFPDETLTTKCASGLCLPGYKSVDSTTSPSSKGYIEKCGEGKTEGKKLCVNYEYCDGRTNTVVQNGLTAGFGIINIRVFMRSFSKPEIGGTWYCNLKKYAAYIVQWKMKYSGLVLFGTHKCNAPIVPIVYEDRTKA